MKQKKIHFLVGLPRTGSTLLGSIIAQNPQIHVTPTSPLHELLMSTNGILHQLNTQYTYDYEAVTERVLRAIAGAYYEGVKEPVIFDKYRGWSMHIPAIAKYLNPDPKLICTVRPIPEIITSYLTLAEKDEHNFIDRDLRKLGRTLTNENRAYLLWENYISRPYRATMQGLQTSPGSMLVVEYNDLVTEPEQVLRSIYQFCNLPAFEHRWKDIENQCAEAKDEAWGLKDLHTIRSSVGKQSKDPSEYLSKESIAYFSQFNITPEKAQRHATIQPADSFFAPDEREKPLKMDKGE